MPFQKIYQVRDALLKVTSNVGHYEAMKKSDKYIVWSEDTEGASVHGDNQKAIQSIQGTADYFTREDGDENVENIQQEFEAAKIPFRLNSVQYEEETGYIHYEWVWEVS